MAIRCLIQLYRRSEACWCLFWCRRGHIASVEGQMAVCLYALYGVSANITQHQPIPIRWATTKQIHPPTPFSGQQLTTTMFSFEPVLWYCIGVAFVTQQRPMVCPYRHSKVKALLIIRVMYIKHQPIPIRWATSIKIFGFIPHDYDALFCL